MDLTKINKRIIKKRLEKKMFLKLSKIKNGEIFEVSHKIILPKENDNIKNVYIIPIKHPTYCSINLSQNQMKKFTDQQKKLYVGDKIIFKNIIFLGEKKGYDFKIEIISKERNTKKEKTINNPIVQEEEEKIISKVEEIKPAIIPIKENRYPSGSQNYDLQNFYNKYKNILKFERFEDYSVIKQYIKEYDFLKFDNISYELLNIKSQIENFYKNVKQKLLNKEIEENKVINLEEINFSDMDFEGI